jgi:hypothetical protein
MGHFEELRTLVNNDDLEIIHISGPARGGTTPLEISMAECGDGLINEPFHFRRRDSFDEGCGSVLSRARTLLDTSNHRPIRLIAKDLAKYLTLEEWQKLMELVRCVIFSIREPTLYFRSLIARRANEVLDDFRGDNLSEDRIFAMLGQIPPEKWMETSWQNLISFLQAAEKKGLPFAVVSNLSLRADPIQSLTDISDNLGIQDIDAVRMATKWTVGTGSGFYTPPMRGIGPQSFETIRKSAWLNKALSSNGFIPLSKKDDSPCDLSRYEEGMSYYVINTILPLYFELMGQKTNPSFRHPQFLKLIRDISNINTIEAYALAVHYQKQYPHSTELERIITELERKLAFEAPTVLRKLQILRENIK